VAVALDDLGAHRVHVQAERREHLALDVRAEVAVRPDRPGDLAGADLVDAVASRCGLARSRTPTRRA
jgi:hypothetical protein